MLGVAICKEALSQGYEVRAFVMPNRGLTVLADLQIETVEGNLSDKLSLKMAVQGCDYIINVAALTHVWPTKNEASWLVNYEGTKNLVEAVQGSDLVRMVHIGSASSFAFGPQNAPGDESRPFPVNAYGLDYINSKKAAQEFLVEQFKNTGFPVIVVCPTYMIGPYDTGPSSGKMILELYKGGLPGYSTGGKNFVYSLDVAKAAVNALHMGRLGECYIAGHENLYFGDFFKRSAQAMNIKFKVRKVPGFLVVLIGAMGSIIARLSGKPPKLSYTTALLSLNKQFYNPKKAVEELKMPQSPIELAVKDAVSWWKSNRYL